MFSKKMRATCSCMIAALLVLSACGGSSPGEKNEISTNEKIERNGPEVVPVSKPEFSAQIRRTEFGVPHVVASDEKGIGFGIGYAYAQDNFCLLAESVITVAGERSKYWGMQNTYLSTFGGPIPNLPSDIYYKVINAPDMVELAWKNQTSESADLIKGYVAGVNRYLKETGRSGLPSACKNGSWVRDISEQDLVRLMRHFALLLDSETLIGGLFALTKPAAVSALSARQRTAAAVKSNAALRRLVARQLAIQQQAGIGSNGVALGMEATESGKGLLLANPHFSWDGLTRFYQLHLTIPGKLDVMGASLSGLPVVNIGFNNDIAWTHTINTSNHSTFYSIELDTKDPTRYKVDGASRQLEKKDVAIEYLDTDKVVQTMTKSIYYSEYGPIFQWSSNAAIALKSGNMNNDRLLRQWWAMNKAKSLEELQTALEKINGVPWAQTIATNKAGNTLYANITPVPNISSTKLEICVVDQLSVSLVLDGNLSYCAWDAEDGTPEKGLIPGAKLPILKRDDYVQNSNDSAWMTNAKARLTGFPDIVSKANEPLSNRTRIGLDQIAKRLDGTDTRGVNNRFNAELLQQIAFSNQSYSATHMLAGLRSSCVGASTVSIGTPKKDVDVAEACSVLTAWDGKANLDSVGWKLYQTWWDDVKGKGLWDKAFDSNDPVHTPSGLKNDFATKDLSLKALARAVTSLKSDFVTYTLPWGQIQFVPSADGDIPIHGGGSEDIYNQIQSKKIPGKSAYQVYFGSSIVMTVSFDGDSPKAQGFLTYSQSSNPASPNYRDQTLRFSKKEWITFPFTSADVEKATIGPALNIAQ